MNDSVTQEDIQRWYGQGTPVTAPLRPGEAETALERFANKTVWSEPDRKAKHTIHLTCFWQVVWLTPGAWLGRAFLLPPGEYDVATFGEDLFVVWFDDKSQLALVRAAR